MTARHPSADPRLYPIRGDVLTKGRIYREVTYLSPSGCEVHYVAKRGGTAVRSCYISTWQRWAKDATVERRAENAK